MLGRTFTQEEANRVILEEIIPSVHGGSAGKISDGYHTFDELYDHRITLWIALLRVLRELGDYDPWRSKLHSDGSNWDGWFILGMDTSMGQATYHIPMNRWNECGCAVTLEKAPEYDGHTPDDVLAIISRIMTPLEPGGKNA